MRPVWETLTDEQQEICLYLCQGLKDREIAERLGRSTQAIKNRMQKIFDATGTDSRLQLAVLLTEELMSDLPSKAKRRAHDEKRSE